MIRHRPDTYGEVVDGIREPEPSASSTGPKRSLRRDLTAREAFRTRAFWLISSGHGIALLSVSTLMVHLIPHLTTSTMAMTLAAAGGVVALMTGSQVAGQIMGGFLGDRFNKRLMCTGCLVGHGAGVAIVAFAESVWMAMLAVVVHGLAWGIRGPLMTAIRADYFGSASFGTIMGFSSLIVMFGMTLGPVFAGYIADVSGDYQLAFIVLAAVSLLGALCFFLATPPKVPETAS